MRHLIAVRHAKSSWSDSSTPDHDRPLNARGRRAAPAVAKALAEAGHVPDLVRSSTAARTRETWSLMAPAFDDPPNVPPRVRFHEQLYMASREAILEFVDRTPAEVTTLMLLGHNPGISQVAWGLVRRGDPDERSALGRGMPTGAAVVVALDGASWKDAGRGGEMVKLILPRRLEDS